jgi:hypothetical protein
MRIVRTTDGRFVGVCVPEVTRGTPVVLGSSTVQILFVTRSGGLVIAGNPNYIITFEQE